MKTGFPTLCCLLCAASAAAPAIASAAEGDACTPSRLMVVLDKSSSMTDEVDGRSKWDIAREAIGLVAGAYEDSVQLGLDVFPKAGECSPGAVVVEPAFGSADSIVGALNEPPPSEGNWTPMSQTLEAVAAEPSLADPDAAPYVVLITDGWQWCYPYDAGTRFDPVDAVSALSQAGVTTFVVGFGDAVDAATLNMMAVMAGTERNGCDPNGDAPDSPDPCYYQADDSAELLSALMDVAGQIPGEEACNATDDDCDGHVDEAVAKECSTACGSGMQMCQDGSFGECDAPAPTDELCNDVDDDCDGNVDEEACAPQEPDGPAELPDAGCGCRADGPSTGEAAALLALPLLFAFVLRRRRGRSG